MNKAFQKLLREFLAQLGVLVRTVEDETTDNRAKSLAKLLKTPFPAIVQFSSVEMLAAMLSCVVGVKRGSEELFVRPDAKKTLEFLEWLKAEETMHLALKGLDEKRIDPKHLYEQIHDLLEQGAEDGTWRAWMYNPSEEDGKYKAKKVKADDTGSDDDAGEPNDDNNDGADGPEEK